MRNEILNVVYKLLFITAIVLLVFSCYQYKNAALNFPFVFKSNTQLIAAIDESISSSDSSINVKNFFFRKEQIFKEGLMLLDPDLLEYDYGLTIKDIVVKLDEIDDPLAVVCYQFKPLYNRAILNSFSKDVKVKSETKHIYPITYLYQKNQDEVCMYFVNKSLGAIALKTQVKQDLIIKSLIEKSKLNLVKNHKQS